MLLSRHALAILTAFGLLLLPSFAPAAEPGQQAWLVDTRTVSECDDDPTPAFSKLVDCAWQEANAADFHAAHASGVPTVIFIHGNRADVDDASNMGMVVYAQLQCIAGDRPFRLVVWSWPSDRIRGPNLRDVRVKACRSDVDGYLLARQIQQIDAKVPITLVGYSFGARVIAVASHLLAGGSLDGRVLPGEPVADRAPLRAVMLAAALDAHWLAPGCRLDRATTLMDSLLVTVNSCDTVLKVYPLMYRIGGPQALGRFGPVCLGEEQEKVTLLDVRCCVGRIHDWRRYLCCDCVLTYLPWFARLPSADEVAAAPAE